ncbi:pyrimidine reductase family protein [Gordonia insulae]|uniref:2,5-diamino-6-ribosylamino-4(3H)-pyrimidinone 5'-phosphate reductase n=1 Tax=Gordonia insulae TaxID=2420509 RepID=A0A3G8JJ25_9ACTN|nr:pyrimidine reductase family protein [Gordonia insulae]AZG44210.1 2,5-diamino-6-ribosylamino-4(3H)-pyrimidinone 5'-phosphate reductase [Gordonia insulae]
MFGVQKATQLTSGDDEAATLRRLAGLYAYPDRPASPPCLPRPFLRANMVSSIDGAVTHNGKSGDLGGPGDRTIFRVLRGLADLVLVGANTAATEGYRQPAPDDMFAADRAAREQHPAPALALVSRSLSIPGDYTPLTHPDTVVVTCRAAPPERRAALTAIGATLIDCGDDTVDIDQLLDVCAERGWVRMLSEGGPSLLGALIDADVVDELCVTTSPTLVAGDSGRIARAPGKAALHAMRPATIITDDDGFVFTRWTRATGEGA